jgi:hypothetical protein
MFGHSALDLIRSMLSLTQIFGSIFCLVLPCPNISVIQHTPQSTPHPGKASFATPHCNPSGTGRFPGEKGLKRHPLKELPQEKANFTSRSNVK